MSLLWDQTKFVFKIENNGRIKISDQVIGIMNNYIQDNESTLEGGGVLLGRFIVDSKSIVVDKITEPMEGDIRKRTFFKRSEKNHQSYIDKEWEDSNGKCNYLGEWHTHPELFPTPSTIDLKGWKKKLQNDVFSSRYLYFVIVGIKEIRIWEGDRRTLRIKRVYSYD